MAKMNISSYNITDVTYHYIGLRVLDGMPPTSKRTEQTEAIASNVLKFVSDRNQRLMVAAPGTNIPGNCEKNMHGVGAIPLREIEGKISRGQI